MKSTIKSVSAINAYGSVYYVIRYLSGREKTIFRSALLPKSVERFMKECPYELSYKDKAMGWDEVRYSLFPIQF